MALRSPKTKLGVSDSLSISLLFLIALSFPCQSPCLYDCYSSGLSSTIGTILEKTILTQGVCIGFIYLSTNKHILVSLLLTIVLYIFSLSFTIYFIYLSSWFCLKLLF